MLASHRSCRCPASTTSVLEALTTVGSGKASPAAVRSATTSSSRRATASCSVSKPISSTPTSAIVVTTTSVGLASVAEPASSRPRPWLPLRLARALPLRPGSATARSATWRWSTASPGATGYHGFGRDRRDWFATVRGRLGYAIDRLLIYGTGGIAFKDRNGNDDFGFGGFGTGIPNGAALVNTGFYVNPAARFAGSLQGPTGGFGFFDDRRRNDDFGFAVGGGLEYALAGGFLGFNNVTAKIEGLYVSFDRDRHHNGSFGGGNVVGVSNTGAAVIENQLVGFGDNRRNRDDFAVVRAGLNFNFGGL